MSTKAYPKLAAQKRTVTGRKVKQLRREGILPANVFGKKIKSQSLQVTLQDFTKVADEVGETGLVDLVIKTEDKPRPVLITNVQSHPVTNIPLHADFHQVDLTEKVTASIPVEIIGESPAVKETGAVLITLLDEIEVEALPADLPEKFVVDIAGLKQFNDSILVKDLPIDTTKVTLKIEAEAQVVMVQEPKEEKIAPTPEEVAATEAAVTAEAPLEGAVSPEASAKGESQPAAAAPTETPKGKSPAAEK